MRTANFASPVQYIMPIVIALVFILLASLIKEPPRQKIMAVMIGGAGAAYLSGGGFGLWEMAFCTVLTLCAYQGLHSYGFIGIGWLLHTGWDVLHHLYQQLTVAARENVLARGNPLLPFSLTSSLGCAICDPVMAIWCFAGAPSLWEVFRTQQTT